MSGKGFKLVIVGTFQKNSVKSRINPVFARVYRLFINDIFLPDDMKNCCICNTIVFIEFIYNKQFIYSFHL